MQYTDGDDVAEQVNHYPFTATKRVFFDAHNVSANLLQVAVATFPPGSSFEAHKHDDMVELFYGTAGKGFINIGEESLSAHSVHPCRQLRPRARASDRASKCVVQMGGNTKCRRGE